MIVIFVSPALVHFLNMLIHQRVYAIDAIRLYALNVGRKMERCVFCVKMDGFWLITHARNAINSATNANQFHQILQAFQLPQLSVTTVNLVTLSSN